MKDKRLRILERVLLCGAFVCLGWYVFASVEAAAYRLWADAELDRMVAAAQQTAGKSQGATAPKKKTTRLPGEEKKASSAKTPAGALIGRIEIPRLKITAPLREGIDDRTLRLAAGHIPDTVLPGRDGNSGVAAHRDTYFRELQFVQKDDEIRITLPDGVVRYRVETTRMVKPNDVWVLNARPKPSLTLVTCYPFYYVGAAPLRFIVWATRVDSPALTQ